MEFDYFGNTDNSNNNQNKQNLLASGWRPLNRDLDLGFLWHLIQSDTRELTQKSLSVASNFAEVLGRKNFTWWANLLSLVSENTRYEIEKYWNYITQILNHQTTATKMF